MGKLRISRGNEWYASAMELHVYINDAKVGVVKHNHYKDFLLKEGEYELFIKIDVLSKKVRIKVEDGKPTMFRVGLPKDIFGILRVFIALASGITLEPVSTDMRADNF